MVSNSKLLKRNSKSFSIFQAAQIGFGPNPLEAWSIFPPSPAQLHPTHFWCSLAHLSFQSKWLRRLTSPFQPSGGPLHLLLPPAKGQAAAAFSACCRHRTALIHVSKLAQSVGPIAPPPRRRPSYRNDRLESTHYRAPLMVPLPLSPVAPPVSSPDPIKATPRIPEPCHPCPAPPLPLPASLARPHCRAPPPPRFTTAGLTPSTRRPLSAMVRIPQSSSPFLSTHGELPLTRAGPSASSGEPTAAPLL
jgi:hypothetical protein